MQIIAEVKTHSPFGWQSSESWQDLFELATSVGDIISVHTDRRWHGSLDLIRQARALTAKPILAKGIHASDADVVAALHAGADYVLVVGRLPNVHLDQCLIEPNTLAELRQLPAGVKAVWNSRDLRTGGLKTATFAQARQIHKGWLCQASNITSVQDVDPRTDAVLVGTHLREFKQSVEAHT